MDLILAPKDMPSITGNFDLYKKDLIKQIEKYKAMPLTDETVAPVKTAIRQIRTTLEKLETTAVGAYFDTPKKLLKAQFAELYNIIADGESKVDAIIAEDTRKRNEATTDRLTKYITSKAKEMAVEKDVIDHVILKKEYYNKTAKEPEVLDNIDLQLVALEKNFAAYVRADKKIKKLAAEVGPVFNKERYLHMLSKYGDDNDTVAAQAEEEAERLKAIPAAPVESTITKSAPAAVGSSFASLQEGVLYSEVNLSIAFPVFNKKTSKGSEEMVLSFTVPKELKKSFTELLKQLKTVGITNKKA